MKSKTGICQSPNQLVETAMAAKVHFPLNRHSNAIACLANTQGIYSDTTAAPSPSFCLTARKSKTGRRGDKYWHSSHIT